MTNLRERADAGARPYLAGRPEKRRWYSSSLAFRVARRIAVSSPSEEVFGRRVSVEQVEEGSELAPKFDASGLIPCVTTDYRSGEVLMVAVMNREALTKTIETGEAHYWSRSRQQLWHKGATSGLIQRVVEMRIDDDQDCVWLRVEIAEIGRAHV